MSAKSTFLIINTIKEVSCGIGSDYEITFIYNNRRFIVLLLRCPLPGFNNPNFIEKRYLKRLNSALESKDSSKINAIIKKISNFIATLYQTIFRESALIVKNKP